MVLHHDQRSGRRKALLLTTAVDAFTVTTSFVPDSIVRGDCVLGEGVAITIPFPRWVAIEMAQAAAQAARDTLV
jgi:hypothetical protein